MRNCFKKCVHVDSLRVATKYFSNKYVAQRYAPMWQDYKIGVIRMIFYSLRFDSIAKRDAVEAVGLLEGRRKLTESKDAFRTSGDVRRRRRRSRRCQRC